MHIILNVESLLKPSGGIGRYTKHLLEGLVESPVTERVTCSAGFNWMEGHEFLSAYNAPITATPPRNNSIQSSLRSRFLNVARSVPFAYQSYAKYKSILFKHRANKYPDAIYHEPNFILRPFSGISIPTIHDLSHIHYPQYHPKERVSYLNRNLANTISRADHILTDSNYVKDEIAAYFDVDTNKISAIPLGVDEVFHPRPADVTKSALAKHGLEPGQYLLSVATLEPRKNISRLIDSFINQREEIKTNFPLVLVGNNGWNNSELIKKIDSLKNTGLVKWLGHINNNDLPYIYAGARAFVFIPYYEGFGLPPLEAMASGIPTLTSHVSSIPEVVGDTGLSVNPGNNEELVVKIEKLLTDEDWRGSSIQMGLDRVKKFTWKNCINQTINAYMQTNR